MKIIFYGGRQVGVIGLLSCIASGNTVIATIPEDEMVAETAKMLGIQIIQKEMLSDKELEAYMKYLEIDLFVCVHGRQIIRKNILTATKRGCINVHPCLWKYKGASPIERLIIDGEQKISVGVHYMTEVVDVGETITEVFSERGTENSVPEIYNTLYPIYSLALIGALSKISGREMLTIEMTHDEIRKRFNLPADASVGMCDVGGDGCYDKAIYWWCESGYGVAVKERDEFKHNGKMYTISMLQNCPSNKVLFKLI